MLTCPAAEAVLTRSAAERARTMLTCPVAEAVLTTLTHPAADAVLTRSAADRALTYPRGLRTAGQHLVVPPELADVSRS